MEFVLCVLAFVAGYFMGAGKVPRGEDENIYKKEYSRTNGLYEPVRRD